MHFLKNIFARFFALWAFLVFITPMLIILPFVWLIGLIDEPKRTFIFINLSRVWIKLFFCFSFVRRKYIGKDFFTPGENYIVVCNHNSFMDVPICSVGIPGANRTIAKISMSKIPLFGLIYKRGSVLVDRKNNESRKASFSKMKAVLDLGMHMCIYPEGTRNKTTNTLQPFHDGAFKLSVESGKSIIPALIFNSKKIIPPNHFFYFWPGKLEMHFLKPVSLSPNETFLELKERVFKIMNDYYLLHNNQ